MNRICIRSMWTSPNTYEYDTATHDTPPNVTAAKPPGSAVKRAVRSSLPVSMSCSTSLYASLLSAAAHRTIFPSGSKHMSLTEPWEVLMLSVTEKSKSTKILQYKTTKKQGLFTLSVWIIMLTNQVQCVSKRSKYDRRWMLMNPTQHSYKIVNHDKKQVLLFLRCQNSIQRNLLILERWTSLVRSPSFLKIFGRKK